MALTDHESKVAAYYDRSILEFEKTRLDRDAPVEQATTVRYLERYVPRRALVADIGVGVGHYAELLARRGCSIHLTDISSQLLEAAEARLQDAGLRDRIAGVHLASATHLHCFKDDALDAVLCLGPLYHLCEPAERRRAVAELARILRQGGIVFAAGINRLAFFRDLFSGRFTELEGTRELLRRDFAAQKQWLDRYLREGNLDPAHAPPIGYAHMTTAPEFRALLSDQFEEIALAGVESFTAPWQQQFAALPENQKALWLELVEKTGTTAEGLAYSDHFLFVGKKR
jgi:ubiquinone/menaquinone biosynthesis C-methylase UbiE